MLENEIGTNQEKTFDVICSVLENGTCTDDEIRVFFLLYHYSQSKRGEGCTALEIATLLKMDQKRVDSAIKNLIKKNCYLIEQSYQSIKPNTYITCIPLRFSDSTETTGRQELEEYGKDIPF